MEKREAQLDARLAEYARAENWSKVLEELDQYEKKNERRHAKHRAGLDIILADREPYDDEFYRRRRNKHWSAAMGSIRFLHHLSCMIQNQLEAEKGDKAGVIDRKLKRRINEKKQAHGLKKRIRILPANLFVCRQCNYSQLFFGYSKKHRHV